jgi:hypothetical protein
VPQALAVLQFDDRLAEQETVRWGCGSDDERCCHAMFLRSLHDAFEAALRDGPVALQPVTSRGER